MSAFGPLHPKRGQVKICSGTEEGGGSTQQADKIVVAWFSHLLGGGGPKIKNLCWRHLDMSARELRIGNVLAPEFPFVIVDYHELARRIRLNWGNLTCDFTTSNSKNKAFRHLAACQHQNALRVEARNLSAQHLKRVMKHGTFMARAHEIRGTNAVTRSGKPLPHLYFRLVGLLVSRQTNFCQSSTFVRLSQTLEFKIICVSNIVCSKHKPIECFNFIIDFNAT